jgi:hypothetical protein
MLRYILLCIIPICIGAQPTSHLSSYPYITGDTFRAFCDHVLDKETTFDPATVKRGDLIFIHADLWAMFFKDYHPHIVTEYILISSNADASCPGEYTSYLDDPHIIAWFGINCTLSHPKLFMIPIGIANRNLANGSLAVLEKMRSLIVPDEQRDARVYAGFNTDTYPRERLFVRDFLKNKPFCLWHRCPFGEYLEHMSQFRYVLSPRGNGIDCYRTWEAILMGCIPVVRTSELDEMYQSFPVLTINNWQQVTSEFLEEQYWLIKNKVWDERMLFIDYWLDKIREIQEPYRFIQHKDILWSGHEPCFSFE